jgi:hypothetical protein
MGTGGSENPAGNAGLVPKPDVLAETRRLARQARAQGLPLWVAGGAAVQLYCQSDVDRFAREPGDIDLAAKAGTAPAISAFLLDAGYVANLQFNALNGKRRLLFNDDFNGRQLDVFLGHFEMCHRVGVVDRVTGEEEGGLLPAAELLLTKLQIVELNPKDLDDILNLLVHLPVAEHDDRAINGTVVARACANDWGLWRTCKLNLDRVDQRAEQLRQELGSATELLRGRATTLRRLIDAEPKSRRWRARSRIGDRLRWYQEPEEVGQAIPIE